MAQSVHQVSQPTAKQFVTDEDIRGIVDAVKGIRIVKEGPIGREHRVERPIAATIEDARLKGWDFWDGSLNGGTWIRNGVKAEKDYPENVGYPYLAYEHDVAK